MSYGVKYRTTYTDLLGVSKKVDILEDGYAGAVTTVNSNRNPVKFSWDPDEDTKYPQLIASSMDLLLLSPTRQYYISLFTSNKFKYKVQYYIGSTIVWQGYILPDIYSETYDNGNYFVTLKAADGIGLLKNMDFVDGSGDPYTGLKSDFEIINICLDKLGLARDIYTAVDIYETTMENDPDDDPLKQAYVDCDIFEDMSCAEVIREILKPYGAILFQNSRGWNVIRFSVFGAAHYLRKYNSSGTYQSVKAIEVELLTGWTNVSFDTFTYDVNDITSAIDDGASNVYANSNTFSLVTGDKIRITYNLTKVSGSLPYLVLYNETLAESTIITLSEGEHSEYITIASDGTYDLYLHATSVAVNCSMDCSVKHTINIPLTNHLQSAANRNVMITRASTLKMIPGASKLVIEQDYGLKDNILKGGDNVEDDFTITQNSVVSKYWSMLNPSGSVYGRPSGNDQYYIYVPGKVSLEGQNFTSFAKYAQCSFSLNEAAGDKIRISIDLSLVVTTPDDDPFTGALDTYVQISLGDYVMTDVGWRLSSSISYDKRYLKNTLYTNQAFQTFVYSGDSIPETGTVYVRVFQVIDSDSLPSPFLVEVRCQKVVVQVFNGDSAYERKLELTTLIDADNNYQLPSVDVMLADAPDVINAGSIYSNVKCLSDGTLTKVWQRIGSSIIEPLVVALARIISNQYLTPSISYDALIKDVHFEFGDVIADPWDDKLYRILAITDYDDSDCEMKVSICEILSDPENDPYLSADESSLSFGFAESDQKFNIDSNVEWSIVSSETWLTVDKPSGSGPSQITATCTEATTERNATLTISADGLDDVVINVTQAGKEFDTDPVIMEFDLAGGSQYLDIISTVTWSVSANSAWLTIEPTGAAGSYSVLVTCESSVSERDGTITFDLEGMDSVVLDVHQLALGE